MAKIRELIEKAKQLNQSFIAITDHGNSSGLYEAYKIGQELNFPVLLGEEFYFENQSETRKNGHLILIAKSERGLSNIFKLQEMAYNNFYYKPRLNMDMLRSCHEDLICTSACVANQINQFLLAGEDHLALGHAKELQKIFGDDFYLELQSSTMEDVVFCNKKLEGFCDSYGFKPIITNDIHYVDEEDYEVHEVLLAIQQKQQMDSPKRWRFEKNDYWLKSQSELEKYLQYLKPDTISKSYDNIEEIFNKCSDVEFTAGHYLPSFLPTKEEEDIELADLTWCNYHTRITNRGENTEEFKTDLFKELSVISDTGYSGYFLIVQEYINWAKANGIQVGDGRGSGAGSKVAYTIGITEVNPQKYDLLFERFLVPGRSPDFDVDFSDIDAVYRHLQDRYGTTNVARVGAFNKFTAKSALRKVMGIYGFPMSEINRVVGLMPDALHFTLDEARKYSVELDKWLLSKPNILHCVSKLEGIMSHFSTHAGGVIICEGLTSKLPIILDAKDKNKYVVAFDKIIIEELGHYKFDILGLNSLILMKDAMEFIESIDWHAVDFDDPKVYDMLCSGDVLGVFQLSEQANKVIEQQPRCFEDLIAINALIRPGVGDWNEYLRRRKDDTNTSYDRGLSYLKSTAGVLVYQDQYLLLANTYAGWDIAYSDKHIRKNGNILADDELKEKFYCDALNKGYPLKEVMDIWNEICDVVKSGYGFNRAHSTSYARLSFQTAYLKYYHPIEFYAAYMTQNFDDAVALQDVIRQIKELNIKVLPPDINKSTDKFIPTNEGVLFPLTAIKGVGGSALYEINRLKPIASIEDFMERRIPKFVKKTTIETLIKSGAFLFTNESIFETLQKYDETSEEKPDYVYEKEALGFYLSDSPFNQYSIPKFNSIKDGEYLSTIVEINDVAVKCDKNNNEMAFATGFNASDTIKLIIFSSVWKKHKCEPNQLVLIRGKKDKMNILVNSIEHIER